MIEIPVSIEKADIAVLGQLKGCVNALAIFTPNEDRVFERETLEFEGFRGLKNIDTGRWDGVFRFVPAQCGTSGRLVSADFGKWLDPSPQTTLHMEDDES